MVMADERREKAIKQLEEKRDFRSHLVVYAAVNTMLIVIWAATGFGYFWPIWPIAGWGIGVALHAFNVYFAPKPISESEIQAEMERDERHMSGHA